MGKWVVLYNQQRTNGEFGETSLENDVAVLFFLQVLAKVRDGASDICLFCAGSEEAISSSKSVAENLGLLRQHTLYSAGVVFINGNVERYYWNKATRIPNTTAGHRLQVKVYVAVGSEFG